VTKEGNSVPAVSVFASDLYRVIQEWPTFWEVRVSRIVKGKTSSNEHVSNSEWLSI